MFTLNPYHVEESAIIKSVIEAQSLYVLAGYKDQLAQAMALQSGGDPSPYIGLCEQFAGKGIQLKLFQEQYLKMLMGRAQGGQ